MAYLTILTSYKILIHSKIFNDTFDFKSEFKFGF